MEIQSSAQVKLDSGNGCLRSRSCLGIAMGQAPSVIHAHRSRLCVCRVGFDRRYVAGCCDASRCARTEGAQPSTLSVRGCLCRRCDRCLSHQHGFGREYFPDIAHMRSSFLGPNLPIHGDLGVINLKQIAPTIADLLGIPSAAGSPSPGTRSLIVGSRIQ